MELLKKTCWGFANFSDKAAIAIDAAQLAVSQDRTSACSFFASVTNRYSGKFYNHELTTTHAIGSSKNTCLLFESATAQTLWEAIVTRSQELEKSDVHVRLSLLEAFGYKDVVKILDSDECKKTLFIFPITEEDRMREAVFGFEVCIETLRHASHTRYVFEYTADELLEASHAEVAFHVLRKDKFTIILQRLTLIENELYLIRFLQIVIKED